MQFREYYVGWRSGEVVSFARYVIRELYGMRLDLGQ
jgi:hypothetical protein